MQKLSAIIETFIKKLYAQYAVADAIKIIRLSTEMIDLYFVVVLNIKNFLSLTKRYF